MSKVTLISNKHNCHVCISVLAGILEPASQVVKGFSPGNIIDKQSTSSTSVIRASDGSEGLLTSSVPNLKLDGLVINSDHASSELDANGEVMHWLEPLVRKLQQKARFPHPCIPNYDVLEQIRVRHD